MPLKKKKYKHFAKKGDFFFGFILAFFSFLLPLLLFLLFLIEAFGGEGMGKRWDEAFFRFFFLLL
jgi:hypothetical protein